MACETCGDKPKKCNKDFTNTVIEINNPEEIILFRKVVIPSSMGDETVVPAAIGKYKNVLLVYEINNHAYLYSSDGIPTLLTSDVAQDLEKKIDEVANDLATETQTRKDTDNSLQQQINTKADAASIGNATLTIQRNSTNLGTFTANSTTNTTVDIEVPTTPADIGAQPLIDSSNKLDADLVDDSTSTNKFVTASDLEKISTALQPEDIDKTVMTDLSLSNNASTTTIELEAAKENLMSGVQTTKSVSMPVASTTQAGVMNSATFDAVANNSNNINALLNGAVAVTGLPASPSQSDITTAWQTETGLTTLINRASVYDVTNNKVWTYYLNDATWHAASNTTQVTINTFTNSSEGTIKGSTNIGQIFAENDGTGSVNGWDTLSGAVSDNTSNITALQTSVAGKQDKLTAGSNITIASNTISATDTKYTAGNGLTLTGTQFTADTSVLQEKLTAGNAISIANNTISADIYPADFFTASENVSGEGTNITLSNTINAPINDVKLYGDTAQQTYSGANLFSTGFASSTVVLYGDNGFTLTKPTYRVVNFDYSTDLPAGTYTISGTVVNKTTANPVGLTVRSSSANLVDLSIGETGSFSSTFTTTEPIHRFYFYILATEEDGATITFDKLQVEAGSTASPFEPYTGGTASPNPDYPQDVQVVTGAQTVKVVGKNLWGGFINDYSLTDHDVAFVNYKDGSISANGTASSSAYSMYAAAAASEGRSQQFPAGTYTLSGGTNAVRAMFIIVGPGTSYTTDATTGKVTFTLSATVSGYIRAYVPSGTSANETIHPQLEFNSTASDYEPYQSQSYTVDLGSIELCKIGGYQDYIYKSGDDWYLHKEVEHLSLAISDMNNSEDYPGWMNLPILTDTLGAGKNSRLNQFTHYKANMCLDEVDSSNYAPIQVNTNNNTLYFGESFWGADHTQTYWKTTYPSLTMELYYGIITTITDTKITDVNLVEQLEALAEAMSYNEQTNFAVTATSTNLPAILGITAFRKSLDGTIGAINNAASSGDFTTADQQKLDGIEAGAEVNVQANWTEADNTKDDYIKNKPSLATVATSGSYADLTNKPTIPTVNDATLTIKENGSTVATFTANSATNTTANISIPVITMTSTDPGEGSPLEANHFIAVY